MVLKDGYNNIKALPNRDDGEKADNPKRDSKIMLSSASHPVRA